MAAEPRPKEPGSPQSMLRDDLTALRRAVRRWSDWREHVRAHPWFAVGLGAGAGCLLALRPHHARARVGEVVGAMAKVAGRSVMAAALAALAPTALQDAAGADSEEVVT